MRRFLIITIDTEGDNCWGIKDIKASITTENARYLPRFQELCEKYGLVPTYLANYEMANSQAFIELGRSCLDRKTAEIGAHLHAWNQPPYFPLIQSPFGKGKPYLGEYPVKVIEKKIESLTNCLKKNFDTEITSFRSGRWYMDGAIVRALERNGYLVDCTCTPGVDWSDNPGWTMGRKGTDWSKWPNRVNRINRICLGGMESGSIVEVPVSIEKDLVGEKTHSWLRPNTTNLEEMKKLIDKNLDSNNDYVEFMIHSSELMPHGSMQFATRMQVERLYENIEGIFSYSIDKGYIGIGLSDYVRRFINGDQI